MCCSPGSTTTLKIYHTSNPDLGQLQVVLSWETKCVAPIASRKKCWEYAQGYLDGYPYDPKDTSTTTGESVIWPTLPDPTLKDMWFCHRLVTLLTLHHFHPKLSGIDLLYNLHEEKFSTIRLYPLVITNSLRTGNCP